MDTRPDPRRRTRALASTLLLAAVGLMLPSGSCSSEVGAVFDPTFQDDDAGSGSGGDGGPTPGDPVAPVDGGLSIPGRPEVLAVAPADGSTGVDVQAPVVLWFSESVNLLTVGPLTLGIRPVGTFGSIGYTVESFAGNRCLAIVPSTDLAVDTRYEVFVSNQVLDLDGRNLRPGNGIVATFRTATSASGVAPRVLGSFPPAGSVDVPNDHPLVLAFSKPINFTGIDAAVTRVGDFPVAESFADDRLVVYEHGDDASDLGAVLSVEVATTLTDTEFVPNPLAEAWSASWSTLEFGRPLSLDVVGEPAVNLGNLGSFPTEVDLAAEALASDTVGLVIHEALGFDGVFTTTSAVDGPGSVLFLTDLRAGPEDPLLEDGPLVAGAFLERNGKRSTFRILDTVVQDTVRPEVSRFGPPFDALASRFLATTPRFRPYGFGSEPIGGVHVSFPPGGVETTRTVEFPSTTGFFVGPALEPGVLTRGPLDFEVRLTDAAGNPMEGPVPATVEFRGFVGPDPAAGSLTVSAFDARTLEPLNGATVYVENATGPADADKGLTDSSGTALFSRSGSQTITVVVEDHHAVTVVAVDASEVSLLLREISPPATFLGPTVSGASSGTLTFASSILEEDGGPDPDLLTELSLPVGFGSVEVLPDRPGWVAAFHEVADYGGNGDGFYFELYSTDPARVIDASDPSLSPVGTLLALVESSNESLVSAGGIPQYIYPIAITSGLGFDTPLQASSASAVVALPGLEGLATVGAGGVSSPPTDAEVEVEIALHALGVVEGAADEVLLQVWGIDADGEEALARVSVPVEPSPGPTAMTIPDIPFVLTNQAGGTYPVDLQFNPSLGGGPGYYRLVLEDNDTVPRQWDVWVPASEGGAGLLTLPSLVDPGTGSGDAPPLRSGAGATWTVRAEAWTMPADFVETGFFFAELRRDALGWARSLVSNPFPVD